jgi:hypothetical protein
MGSQRTLRQDLLKEIFELRDGVLYRDGEIAGDLTPKGYWRVQIGDHKYFRAKIVWCMVHGNWPKEVDHRNRQRSDDRIENLREATHSQNIAHQPPRKRTTGLPNGVYRHRNKYRVRMRIGGKMTCFPVVDTPEEAHEIYKAQHLQNYKEFSIYGQSKNA